MKFQLHSDLHLEFAPYAIKNAGADVLLLAGDICVASGFNTDLGARFLDFFDTVCHQFEAVCYVPGNHEFYGDDLSTGVQTLRDKLPYQNLHILDNSSVVFGDTKIVGTTLWSDIESRGPLVQVDCVATIADYQQIHHNGQKLTPRATSAIYRKNVTWLKTQMDHDKCILLTHHAPSNVSASERYRCSNVGAAYWTDLSELILDNPQIKLLHHGHMHNCVDYHIGDTRIINNPRGYATLGARDFSPLVVTL